mgnify:CR=1 FL=1
MSQRKREQPHTPAKEDKIDRTGRHGPPYSHTTRENIMTCSCLQVFTARSSMSNTCGAGADVRGRGGAGTHSCQPTSALFKEERGARLRPAPVARGSAHQGGEHSSSPTKRATKNITSPFPSQPILSHDPHNHANMSHAPPPKYRSRRPSSPPAGGRTGSCGPLPHTKAVPP